MTFPSPHPAAQNSIASSTSQNSGSRAGRAQQSPWGLPPPAPGARRVPGPLSTDLSSSPIIPSGPPSSNITSPSSFTSTFPSVINSSTRHNGRNSYTAPPTSLFAPQTGSQQPNPSQILSPRSRAITPSSSTNLASSAAASTTAAQGGGGSSGGGSSRTQAFSPSLPHQNLGSPTNNSFDRSAFNLPNSASTNSGVSKIVATQVFLLLGSITEKEGKAKWDSQAEAIRKVSLSDEI